MVQEEVIITLSGGAPWGFRLQGGVEHQKPLQVAKVRQVTQQVEQKKMFSWGSYFMVCMVCQWRVEMYVRFNSLPKER